ncbi:hypothetical protein [Campylobacter californiensis]|uniref:hypothetical protein n=1 Tax=Campylobacter californiensis TaxID=1032243 RepID=UPI001473237A|nr:hypothetical protein [Campylobacter sp. RM12916]MBE3610503.1 hypothetical protein [Campylobacter sp. RM12916]
MNRVAFIKEALNVNETQALIINELIKPIKDNELVPFFAYRANFIQPKQSVELITKNAVFAYRKERALAMIKAGEFKFKSIEQLSEFVRTFFKNERLCYGAAGYYDFVIIGVDENGNLINHYNLNDAGKPKQIGSENEYEVYTWLLNNQDRIGAIKFISQKETKTAAQISNKSEEKTALEIVHQDPDAILPISQKARELLAKAAV